MCFGARDNYDIYLSLDEFTYNNSLYSSIGMTPFEALYDSRFMTHMYWYDSGESVVFGPVMVHQTSNKIKMIQEKMKAL